MIRRELSKVVPPVVEVTSLAVGADQLLAKLVLERGGTIYAVLPFADIERSLPPVNIKTYHELTGHATDEDAYLAAGQRVVEISDILLAVWDGKPAKGKGGTADVVALALDLGVPLVHIDPKARSVRKTG